MKKTIAIIPARGGSKRVPRKNIKNTAGKPLIAWTIQAALNSKNINRVIISTDDKEIAKVALKYGAEVPFLRPADLATDTLGIEPVLRHVYEELIKKEKYTADAIALLMPTNPLKIPKHLDEAIELFYKKKLDSLISATEALGNLNPHWIIKKSGANKVVLFNGDSLKKIRTRSQDLPLCYSRNDIIYVLRPHNLYQKPSNLYGDKTDIYPMDEFFHSDINSFEDFYITLDKLKRLKRNNFNFPIKY